MRDRVLVDTSAWITFFRRKDRRLYDLVSALLRAGEAVGAGLILLELVRGAKSSRELNVITELFRELETVSPTETTYMDAGKMGYELARKGHTLGVVDLILAQLALENDLSLLTLDQHFETIAKKFPLKLIRPPQP